MKSFKGLPGIALAAIVSVSAGAALADYPERTINMIVPFSAGGPNDTIARAIAAGLEEELDQTIIVENKPGAAGNIGTLGVVRAEPDGYTILFVSSGPMLINTTLYSNAGYDPRTDLTPIALAGTMPNVVLVNPSIGVTDMKGLAEYAKANEGVSYGSAGAGNTTHIAGFMLSRELDDRLMHVPYPGTAAAMKDLLGGHISLVFSDTMTAMPYIESGALTALAVAPERSAVLPDVPTLAEQGFDIEDINPAFGILGPPDMPEDVVDTLNDAIQATLDSPEMTALMARLGMERAPIRTSVEFADYIRSEVDRLGEMVRLTGVTID
ncbi:tripartite tricarboxylate transporter substrate binding protein [Paracoccus sp. MC1854]|uniref:Bug family tripartite tricarboxylate transporter substrate binding protein n=1 Tax=Paracoccus sp. MC1854 TaxID=2760306 RepID=UPI00160155D8|nr:tripartite tricarboxylate transporter substrate binding protein [Paracoccus sp. MC1854]MBB1492845.1 tripartite tricarboxylate transporter substrate binding protein [Paracoccus sp. MC1854]